MLLKKIIALTLLSLFPSTQMAMSKSQSCVKALLKRTPCFLLGSALGASAYVMARTHELDLPDYSNFTSHELYNTQLQLNQGRIDIEKHVNLKASPASIYLPPICGLGTALVMPGLVKPIMVGTLFGTFYTRHFNHHVMGDALIKVHKHAIMEKALNDEIEKRST